MGATALIIGANLPDVDAVAYFAGPLADLEWRRGWTHGVLALVLFPLLLTGALLLIHRTGAGRRNREVSAARPKQLLLLSAIAVLSHPILDTLNTYGVRWLMPFSGRWYYGDAVFIVDPWVWLMLAAGVLWTWRRRRAGAGDSSRPAQWALAIVAVYATAMWVAGLVARGSATRKLEAGSGRQVLRAMAGPLPLTLLSRSYVAEQESEYRVGTVRLLAGWEVKAEQLSAFPRGRPGHPAYAAAESTLVFQRFLGWARFPTFMVEPVAPGDYLVHAIDLRYATEPGSRFGTVTVPVRLP